VRRGGETEFQYLLNACDNDPDCINDVNAAYPVANRTLSVPQSSYAAPRPVAPTPDYSAETRRLQQELQNERTAKAQLQASMDTLSNLGMGTALYNAVSRNREEERTNRAIRAMLNERLLDSELQERVKKTLNNMAQAESAKQELAPRKSAPRRRSKPRKRSTSRKPTKKKTNKRK